LEVIGNTRVECCVVCVGHYIKPVLVHRGSINTEIASSSRFNRDSSQ
jgi:hypothetical protein